MTSEISRGDLILRLKAGVISARNSPQPTEDIVKNMLVWVDKHTARERLDELERGINSEASPEHRRLYYKKRHDALERRL